MAEVFSPHPTSQCRTAFTLAEVLITLGIIGVVAAMTMPVLMQNSKKQEYSSKLKKFYSVMGQAVTLSEIDNGPALDWELSSYRDQDGQQIPGGDNRTNSLAYFNKYLKPYLKYVSLEENSDLMEDGQTEDDSSRFFKLVLADGSLVYMKTGTCFDMRYDLTGPKGANTMGKDIFGFLICPRTKAAEYCGVEGRAFCTYGTSYDRNEALSFCERVPAACSRLLQIDNWEFRSDYPWKI